MIGNAGKQDLAKNQIFDLVERPSNQTVNTLAKGYLAGKKGLTFPHQIVLPKNKQKHSVKKEMNTIRIFPNPADSYINIEFEEDWKKLEYVELKIQNSQSQLVLESKISPLDENFEINHLKEGIYLISIYTKEGQMLGANRLIVIR